MTSAVWFLNVRDRGTKAGPQSEAARKSTNKTDERRVIVPLWDTDGMREASAAANALDANWHMPAKPFTRDPWSEETQDLQQQLAKLSSEFESSGARIPVRGTGKTPKESFIH